MASVDGFVGDDFFFLPLFTRVHPSSLSGWTPVSTFAFSFAAVVVVVVLAVVFVVLLVVFVVSLVVVLFVGNVAF